MASALGVLLVACVASAARTDTSLVDVRLDHGRLGACQATAAGSAAAQAGAHNTTFPYHTCLSRGSADSLGGPMPIFQINMTSTNTHVSVLFLTRICSRLGWDFEECMAPLLLQGGALVPHFFLVLLSELSGFICMTISGVAQWSLDRLVAATFPA
eukprot:3200596-Alexandrium_andersonii.AAC.1